MSLTAATVAATRPALERTFSVRLGALLDVAVFSGLLLLMIIAAAAYGGADPWSKSLLASLIFALGVLAAVEFMVSDNRPVRGLSILLPITILIAFALSQTIPSPQSSGAPFGINYRFWNAISADPYETRIFALQLTALMLFAGLLFRYVTSVRRLRLLLHTIIGIALVSALFGLLRQTMQHQPGFLFLPFQPDQGYGQFLNKNHFSYLMEIGFGLVLGLVAAGSVKRQRILLYLAAFVPIWTALVLSNSRGGILAMLVQFIVAILLFPVVAPAQNSAVGTAERLIRSPSLRLVTIFCLVIVIAVGVLWVGGDRLVTSIEAVRGEFSEADEAREGAKRTQIWQATLRMIEAHPIAGVGMGGYWAEIPKYHQASGNMTPQQAHNDYLELLASGGILGLAISVWFAVGVVRSARLNLQRPDRFLSAACFAALIAIVGIAAHSLVDFGLHRMSIAMIFTALIVIATCNVNTARSRQSEDV